MYVRWLADFLPTAFSRHNATSPCALQLPAILIVKTAGMLQRVQVHPYEEWTQNAHKNVAQ